MKTYKQHHQELTQKYIDSLVPVDFEGKEFLLPPGAKIGRTKRTKEIYAFLEKEKKFEIWFTGFSSLSRVSCVWDGSYGSVENSPNNREALNSGDLDRLA